MNDKELLEQKQLERKKNIGGFVLSLIIFGWFLYYLISHIPA